MSQININNLTFTYEGSYDPVFENVSLRLDSSWRLGLAGRNGRGKTTFLKLLQNELPHHGAVTAAVDFEYFPYEIEDKESLTIDVASGVYAACEHWQLVRECSLLQVSEDVLYRPFDTLSSGEQTKVLLAVMFLKENNFLLIDEPTNHLDAQARSLLSRYLQSKKSYILISHDRAFLDGCIDHILSINKADIQLQKGNFSSWYENKIMQDQFEISQNEKLKRELSRLTESSLRTSRWSNKVEKTKYNTKNSGLRPDRGYVGHKAAKMMKTSKVIEARAQTAIEEKSKLLKNVESLHSLKISQLVYHKRQLAALDKVFVYYGAHCACKDISFTIEQGDRIALTGGNGSGKSSILKLICGEDLTYMGSFSKGSRLLISYVPQDATALSGSLTEHAARKAIDESLFKAILQKLDFTKTQFEKDMASLSEGQKKKVLIASSLCEKAHLHIWDEPLNFIDIFSRMQIEQLLLSFEPTILFVEHDSFFTRSVATKTIHLP
jgi:lincosamide and streptogramin A transport system ATP-binding/permease protein